MPCFKKISKLKAIEKWSKNIGTWNEIKSLGFMNVLSPNKNRPCDLTWFFFVILALLTEPELRFHEFFQDEKSNKVQTKEFWYVVQIKNNWVILGTNCLFLQKQYVRKVYHFAKFHWFSYGGTSYLSIKWAFLLKPKWPCLAQVLGAPKPQNTRA